MSDKYMKRPVRLTETEISKNLRIVAVRRGLRIPETPEEVAAFEEVFGADISNIARNGPTFEEVATRVKQLKDSGIKLSRQVPETVGESQLAMAARNGTSISPETEAQMDAAIAKVKGKMKPDGC